VTITGFVHLCRGQGCTSRHELKSWGQASAEFARGSTPHWYPDSRIFGGEVAKFCPVPRELVFCPLPIRVTQHSNITLLNDHPACDRERDVSASEALYQCTIFSCLSSKLELGIVYIQSSTELRDAARAFIRIEVHSHHVYRKSFFEL
jgi:hypothetical protein